MTALGRRHALVIGSSMAGLAAATVLANHFEGVTVLERRHRPAWGESTAAQGRMLHLLLESGAAALERMLPGIRDELRSLGAVDGTYANVRHWNEGYRLPFDSGITSHMASRGLIETAVRERVSAIPHVTIRHDAAANGLLTTGAAVVGVRTSRGDVPADLVIDCSGRTSRASDWLAAEGFPRPATEEVGVEVRYAGTTVPDHPGISPGPENIIVTQPDDETRPRGGAALRIEGAQWMVALGGYFGDRPPTDLAGYLGFAESLPTQDLATLLHRATDMGPIISYSFRSSLRRHYEATPPPPGFLALGDAMCSFNPLYGQGIAVAVLEAVALDELLSKHGNTRDLPQLASRAFSKIIDNPWQIAVETDLAYPSTTGRRSPRTRLSNRYGKQTLRATTVDPVVGRAVLEVQHLLAPPSSLLRPHILIRTLRAQRAWRDGHSDRGGAGNAAGAAADTAISTHRSRSDAPEAGEQ